MELYLYSPILLSWRKLGWAGLIEICWWERLYVQALRAYLTVVDGQILMFIGNASGHEEDENTSEGKYLWRTVTELRQTTNPVVLKPEDSKSLLPKSYDGKQEN